MMLVRVVAYCVADYVDRGLPDLHRLSNAADVLSERRTEGKRPDHVGRQGIHPASATVGDCGCSQPVKRRVADTFGAAGNAVDATQGRVDVKHATLLICAGAVVLRLTPTSTLLAFASRAFAFYYMLQCFVAASLAKSGIQKSALVLMAAVLAFITTFAVPAG